MRTVFLDGQYLTIDPQMIEVFTPGVFKAKGVFETMLGTGQKMWDAHLHLKRLRRGLRLLGLKAPTINPSLLKEVLRRNHLSCSRVRLMVWQAPFHTGQAPSHTGQAGQQTHVMAVAMPYEVPHHKPYRVCLIKTGRRADSRLADVKSLDHELFARAYAQARARGFDEALLLNRRGHIFEASRANIFWVRHRVLYTPPLSSGCLKGITRRQVIQQAKRLKIPVYEKNLTPAILQKADAAFLTNSLIGIKPIVLDE